MWTRVRIVQSRRELERLCIHIDNWALNKKRIILPNARMILLKEVVLTQIALRINDPFSKSVGVFS